MTVSALNVGIAAAAWRANEALEPSLGTTGPAIVNAAMVILGLIPLFIHTWMLATLPEGS